MANLLVETAGSFANISGGTSSFVSRASSSLPSASGPPGSGSSVMQSIDYYATRYWQEHGEPRFHKSTLMGGGPWQMLTITLTYLVAIKLFGPYLMRKRKPMENLIWPIRLYNAFMVAFNAYLYINFSKKVGWGLDCWGCGKSMQRMDQTGLILWELTLLSRYFDFFDSIFFVCRKKYDHLSVLHVTHHTLVPIIVWFAGKLEPTPMVVFAGYINLPIHVIMYSYYCLSTFPSLKPFLWWKKYLTTIQIIQFGLDLLHSLQIIYIPNCKYHPITYVQTAFSLTFLYLFFQFYLRSYINQRQSSKSKIIQSSDSKEYKSIEDPSSMNGHHLQQRKPISEEDKKLI